MQIKSEEINYLVYRYLIESGFSHSAFSLSHEATIPQSLIKADQVPSGSLVALLHKGLQYVDVEIHVNDDGSLKKCTQPLSLVERHFCVLPEPNQAQKRPDLFSKTTSVKQEQKLANKLNLNTEHAAFSATAGNASAVSLPSSSSSASFSQTSLPLVSRIGEEHVTYLSGHSAEVYTCAWSPSGDLLATGSGDSTARIWKIQSDLIESIELSAPIDALDEAGDLKKKFIITALDWDRTGKYLAAGTSDGQSVVWSKEGQLICSSSHHSASIFAIKWNPNSKVLLAGSEDSSISISDPFSKALIYAEKVHKGSVMDVDWKNEICFASCSQDGTIKYFIAAGSNSVTSDEFSVNLFKEFDQSSVQAHDKEINAIRWDPSGSLLVSCSDDKSAKLWTQADSSMNILTLLHTFTGHTDGIYTIEWNPIVSSSLKSFATASFDGTVRLWDTSSDSCTSVLSRHSKSVYSISFSSDGKFIASGSVDKNVYIWEAHKGTLEFQFSCKGGVYDLAWNPASSKISVCTTKNTVMLLDIPSLPSIATADTAETTVSMQE